MKLLYSLLFLVTFSGISPTVFAQHEHHQTKPKTAPVKPAAKTKTSVPATKKETVKPARPVAKPKLTPAKPQTDSTTIDQQEHAGHEMAAPALIKPQTDSAEIDQSGHQHHQTENPDTTLHQKHSQTRGTESRTYHQHFTIKKLYYPGNMSHAFSRNLPMTRNGSGTSWNPDATPMYAYMFSKGSWNFMAHGSIFLRYTNQDIFEAGTRGDSKLDAPNWFMLMTQRKIGGKGLFNFNVMMSLDPITEKTGYPLLFQSGETYQDKPLVDRQHPHDLFSELSLGYTHAFSEEVDLTGYFGYPGEPTIGPTAFMHRLSSMNNPDAPLGHHWQDASHIQFGVATLGLRYRNLKLEGSNFTGREPDENRYNFDKPRFDSYSYRLQSAFYALNQSFVFQFSQGFLKSPEVAHPEEDVVRTTASLLFSEKWFTESKIDRHLTAALVWGHNKKADHAEHSVLLEGNYQCRKMAYYTRYEFIQKDSQELQITEDHGTGAHAHHELFNVYALTLGTNRTLANFWNLNLALGVQTTVYSPEKSLHEVYGKLPVSGQVYLRLVPDLMQMHYGH